MFTPGELINGRIIKILVSIKPFWEHHDGDELRRKEMTGIDINVCYYHSRIDYNRQVFFRFDFFHVYCCRHEAMNSFIDLLLQAITLPSNYTSERMERCMFDAITLYFVALLIVALVFIEFVGQTVRCSMEMCISWNHTHIRWCQWRRRRRIDVPLIKSKPTVMTVWCHPQPCANTNQWVVALSSSSQLMQHGVQIWTVTISVSCCYGCSKIE